jgi:lipopolysaccharide/colanic/teichoic acid biosynthesis glycosyltransferase
VFLPPAIGLTIADMSWGQLWTRQSLMSFAWAVLGAVTGLWLQRGLVKYPGLNSGAYVLPMMLVSFAAIVLLMFFFRISYSRYVIGTAFFSGYAWLQVMFYMQDRLDSSFLAIIPGDHAASVSEIKSVQWTVLNAPEDSLVGISGVVADLSAEYAPQWERFIAQSTLAGIPVFDIKVIRETLTGKSDITHLSETSFGSLLPSNIYLRTKHSLDVIVALVLLPVFVPVILLTALAIKLESRGPAFFVQPRVGYRAGVFKMWKLRSMSTDVETGGDFTHHQDPRITRVGSFIRKYRIDELPQIFNILRGEMSWIGPRPEAVALSEWYATEIPFYAYRHAVRPGISGWAQVNQGNVAEINAATEKLRYDFYYIKHFSPFLDILIVLRTIHTIATGFGSR